MTIAKLHARVLAEVQRQFSLKGLSDDKRHAITANMLTSLLDMQVSLKM
jgi:hypothetical protein